jgi:glycerol-3-phosphate acyltransferase PlsX
MGGDRGAVVVVEGCVDAVKADGERVVIVGRAQELHAALDTVWPSWRVDAKDALRVVDADDVVSMDDKAADAARKKKRSSMRVATDLVADGDDNAHAKGHGCCGMVSTGNTGALLATALVSMGRLPGVARPAIATTLPSLSKVGRTVLIDAGANTECDPVHLGQWGLLASVFLERAYGQERPAVGVLSNGEEDNKGTPLTREALAILRQTSLNVVGFCEGRDLNEGVVHVVVTDGFTGNVVLKTAEGVFSFMSAVIKKTFAEGSPIDKVGGLLSQPGWNRIRKELDPREFGAAPLLGLAHPAFIAHGKSDPYAVRCGIRAVRRFVDKGVIGHIQGALDKEPALAHKRGSASEAEAT